VLTDDPGARFAPGTHLYPEGAAEPLTVAEAWAAALGWIIRFREIPSRSAAAAYLSVYLEADAGIVPALPRGSYYWHELMDCPVVDPEGGALGIVRDVYRSGGAEILVVEGGPRGAFDLPVARPFVRILAPRRGEIVADPDTLDLPTPEQIRPPRPPRPPWPRKGEQSASRPRSATDGPLAGDHGAPEAAPVPEAGPGPGSGPETARH
jgi:16S rRNA processing protein RimM